MMKQVNEARDCLLDEEKRKRYDRELDSCSSPPSGTSSDLEQENRLLKLQVNTLRAQQRSSDALANAQRAHIDHLQHQNRASEAHINALEWQNERQAHELNRYGQKLARAEKDLEMAVREERRKSSEQISAAVREERKRADAQIEQTKRSLNERSICFRCKGEGGTDCLCLGYGVLHGLWTTCHACRGKGAYVATNGIRANCSACFSKGAKQGVFTIVCFKCKGSGASCDTCHEGKVRGFNLKCCPFCKGNGCDNCHERGYV